MVTGLGQRHVRRAAGWWAAWTWDAPSPGSGALLERPHLGQLQAGPPAIEAGGEPSRIPPKARPQFGQVPRAAELTFTGGYKGTDL